VAHSRGSEDLTSRFSFEWRPFLLAVSGEPEDPEQEANTRKRLQTGGVRYTDDDLHPSVTHWIHNGDLGVSFSMMAAAMSQAHILSDYWALELVDRTMLPAEEPADWPQEEGDERIMYRATHAATVGSDPRFLGLSPLEQDSAAHWPAEDSHPPSWTECDKEFGAPGKWKPKAARKKMFQNIFFASFDSDSQAFFRAVIERGGGSYLNLETVGKRPDQVEKVAKDAIAKRSAACLTLKTFFFLESLDPTSKLYQLGQK
jgi:hypothetical protein